MSSNFAAALASCGHSKQLDCRLAARNAQHRSASQAHGSTSVLLSFTWDAACCCTRRRTLVTAQGRQTHASPRPATLELNRRSTATAALQIVPQNALQTRDSSFAHSAGTEAQVPSAVVGTASLQALAALGAASSGVPMIKTRALTGEGLKAHVPGRAARFGRCIVPRGQPCNLKASRFGLSARPLAVLPM